MCLTYRDQCVQLWGPGKDSACSKTCCPLSQKMFYSCCSSLCCSSLCARQEYLPHLLSAAESEEPFLLPYSCGGGSKKFPMLQPFQKKGQMGGWHGVRWSSHLSLFLAGAWPAPDACFEMVNAAGDIYGNCGKDMYDDYRKCDIRYKADWQPRVAHWRRFYNILYVIKLWASR